MSTKDCSGGSRILNRVLVKILKMEVANSCWLHACLTFRPWRWRQLINPKRWKTSTRFHNVISQTILLFSSFIVDKLLKSFPNIYLFPPLILSYSEEESDLLALKYSQSQAQWTCDCGLTFRNIRNGICISCYIDFCCVIILNSFR
jgi:hypothetical protein